MRKFLITLFTFLVYAYCASSNSESSSTEIKDITKSGVKKKETDGKKSAKDNKKSKNKSELEENKENSEGEDIKKKETNSAAGMLSLKSLLASFLLIACIAQ